MLNGGLAFWLCCSSEWKGGVPLKIDGTNLICRGLGRVARCTLTVEDLSQLENPHTRGSQVPLFSLASRSLGRFGSCLLSLSRPRLVLKFVWWSHQRVDSIALAPSLQSWCWPDIFSGRKGITGFDFGIPGPALPRAWIRA